MSGGRARVALVAVGAVALGVAGAAWVVRGGLGFPDGHLTDRERAEGPLLAALAIGAGGPGLALVGLGIVAPAAARRAGWALVGLAGVAVVGVAAWAGAVLPGLDDGRGG